MDNYRGLSVYDKDTQELVYILGQQIHKTETFFSETEIDLK